MGKFLNKLGTVVRQADIYGRMVVLTYKGKRYYKTSVGAAISIVLLLAIGTYLFLQLKQMVAGQNTKINVINYNKDLIQDASDLDLGDSGVTMAFRIRNYEHGDLVNRKDILHPFINIVIAGWINDINGKPSREKLKIPVPLTNCP